MRTVYKVLYDWQEGTKRLGSLHVPPRDGRWHKTYRTATGARTTVGHCMAFPTEKRARAYAGRSYAGRYGVVFRAHCDKARSIRRMAWPGDYAAFQRADGRKDGWAGTPAPAGTLYCKGLRIDVQVWPETQEG